MMVVLQVPTPSMSVLAGESAAAARYAGLGIVLLSVTIAVGLLVVGLLLAGLRRGGRGESSAPPLPAVEPAVVRRWVLWGGAAFPAAVLGLLLVVLLVTLRASGAEASVAPDIEVVGHQWWWEVRYPGTGIVTANEIHIPVDSAVRVRVRTADVIHSLWVPRLQGKLDMIPGKDNQLRLSADEPGIYRGQCAEYCGGQHARMDLFVVAHEPAAYQAWRRAQLQPAAPPRDALAQRGGAVFGASGCAFCHTVRGTPARGTFAPDLTHVASRLSIAAGLLPTTQAALAGWVANPQVLKPGTLMPAYALPGEDLRALAAYLETLQ